MNSFRTARFVFAVLLAGGLSAAGETVRGTVLIRSVTGRDEIIPFAHHPGWLEAIPHGESTGVSARVGDDARFEMPLPERAATLILSFDKIETPPVIEPYWPAEDGSYDVILNPDYAVFPSGYPQTWDSGYKIRGLRYWQTFVARSGNLWGCTLFDAEPVVWWGNKMNVALFDEGPYGGLNRLLGWEKSPDEEIGAQSAQHSRYDFPRIGWRPGDVELDPGRKYAIRVRGYRSHGGQKFDAHTFCRPDSGRGYEPGEAYDPDRRPMGGDLCMLLWGDRDGRILENTVRSEEWEILLPKHPPVPRWGETFRNHGRSAAGIVLWASAGGTTNVTCTMRLRADGPDGRAVGPAKTVAGHVSPDRPVIRYPEIPGPLEGYERFYERPFLLFQAAFTPDEALFEPGETGYVDLEFSQPVLVFADGDFDPTGHAYYGGRRIDEEHVFHSDRWTLMMQIVTYANPGGAPTVYELPPSPAPEGDNLVVNGGGETGDFRGWTVVGDPLIDPQSHLPDPAHHGGNHHFGISAGWAAVDVAQYQEIRDLEPGRAYRAGFRAAHQDGTDEVAQLLYCDGAYGNEERLIAETEEAAQPEWTYVGGPLTPMESTVTLIVRYKHPIPTNIASIHVDDIELRPAE